MFEKLFGKSKVELLKQRIEWLELRIKKLEDEVSEKTRIKVDTLWGCHFDVPLKDAVKNLIDQHGLTVDVSPATERKFLWFKSEKESVKETEGKGNASKNASKKAKKQK